MLDEFDSFAVFDHVVIHTWDFSWLSLTPPTCAGMLH